jgi:hypothetical protein
LSLIHFDFEKFDTTHQFFERIIPKLGWILSPNRNVVVL